MVLIPRSTIPGIDGFVPLPRNPESLPIPRTASREGNMGAERLAVLSPGTELKKALAKLGFKPAANCKCNEHIVEMNSRGIDWCSQNIDTIVGWLKEEAERVKRDKQEAIRKLDRINSSQEERPTDAAMRLIEARAAAMSVPFTAIGAKIIVKRAISNARKRSKLVKTMEGDKKLASGERF